MKNTKNIFKKPTETHKYMREKKFPKIVIIVKYIIFQNPINTIFQSDSFKSASNFK